MRERENKVIQLRSEIQCLEGIINRTSQQEQELQTKKEELTKLEQQNTQQPTKTNYLP